MMPDEISYGSLCDLGDLSYTTGAIMHGVQAALFPLMNYAPISKKIGDDYQKKREARNKNK